MDRDQARKLIEKYNNGTSSTEESAWVENWYMKASHSYKLSDNESEFLHLKNEIWNATVLNSGLAMKSKSKMLRIWPRIAAAVVILIAFSAGFYFYAPDKPNFKNSMAKADVAPGGNKAILTLANGEKVILNDVLDGQISKQAGVSVSKLTNGELVYTVVEGDSESVRNTRNTISTPKGGQYRVILSDGTRVMLNSESSLTFSTALDEKERMVELSGEAYFEVAKHKKRFLVISGTQTVEVLGTHFNVNAYKDERTIKTTLLEGVVRVSTSNASASIEPGEQAVLDRKNESAILKRRVNTSKETAWINGVFSFEGDDLKSVMRQISRWYDVNIVYTGALSEEKYFGEISMNSKLSEVFKILELNNVNFDVEGKTVKVSYNQRSSSSIDPNSKK